MKRFKKLILIGIILSGIPSLACLLGRPAATAIPAGRPADFEVQTATPTLDPALITPEPAEAEAEAAVVIPLGDAPTDTPDPSLVIPTEPPPGTATPTLAALVAATSTVTAATSLTSTAVLTETEPPVAAPPPVEVELDPPLEGGDWDFEAEFIPWPNPHGEPCPGARVASSWTAFVEKGEYGSSCMNENLYGANVFSGLKSQEITFDFIASNSGVYRTIPTTAGHRYNIVAYGKHDWSIAPVELFLGVDLTGGAAWDTETVTWFPWDDGAEDTWNATEETVTATGEAMTIFLRARHPMADQGGKTVFDNVSVIHLGP